MIDLVKALRNRATWETATGITEPHEHIDWMAAEEITRLREENARLREALKPFGEALKDNYYHQIDAFPIVAGSNQIDIRFKWTLGELRAAAAAIREKRSFATEGGKDE